MVGLINSRAAQGTIEYLVILAVVVVIGLVVVGLATSTFSSPAQQLSSASSQIGASTGPIAISNVAIDSSGKGVLEIGNNSGDDLEISRIVAGGKEVIPSENYSSSGQVQVFTFDDIGAGACGCASGQSGTKTCEIVVYAQSRYGTARSYSYSVSVNCVQDAQPSDPGSAIPPADLAPPAVSLSGPQDGNANRGEAVVFSFSAADDSGIASCSLFIDGNAKETINSGFVSFSPQYFSGQDALHAWSVSCLDTKGNQGFSAPREISLDLNQYQLTYCGELQNVGASGNYFLMNDINCWKDTHEGGALWNSGQGFAPIASFSGRFDGQGRAITGLHINRPSSSYVGLFGYVGGSALVSNVRLDDANVAGGSFTGILAGQLGGGTVSGCGSGGYVRGNCVWHTDCGTGGLVGFNSATITSSYSSASASGSSYVGGLVGRNDSSVTASKATGDVTSTTNAVGGLVGDNRLSISDSYSTGDVTSGAMYVGGLTGNTYQGASVDRCYATGKVSGAYSTSGGLVGSTWMGTVINSFSTGDVNSSGANVGGLIGAVTFATLDNCFYLSSAYPSCIGSGFGNCLGVGSEDYFFDVGNNPYANTPWNFGGAWSSACDGAGYPTLAWEGVTDPGQCET